MEMLKSEIFFQRFVFKGRRFPVVMGRWTTCPCGNCTPSEQLRGLMSGIVDEVPEHWIFEVYMEGPGHNYLIRKPDDEGSWIVGAYIETNNPTLLELVLVCHGGNHYYLKVKAEHNSCPFEFENDFAEQIHLQREDFLEHWPELFSPEWKISQTRSDAKSSVSIAQFPSSGLHPSFNEISYSLLEAIDEIEEKGWTAN